MKLICNTLLILIFFTNANAELKEDLNQHAGKTTMNDIEFDKYKNFSSLWSLVTVRFRKDTGEQRLTYANDIALKAIKEGIRPFPDGSVLGKIGILTQEDPLFVSSAVPSGKQRYQLMVKNSKKYKDQNGWGYALFDINGKTFPENPKTQIHACHSCHLVAEENDYVFSKPMGLDPHPAILSSQISYTQFDTKNISEEIKFYLKKYKKVHLLNGPFQEAVFQGTLNELRPMLIKKAQSKNEPALFMAKNSKAFVLALPSDKNCVNSLEKQINIYETVIMSDYQIQEASNCLSK